MEEEGFKFIEGKIFEQRSAFMNLNLKAGHYFAIYWVTNDNGSNKSNDLEFTFFYYGE